MPLPAPHFRLARPLIACALLVVLSACGQRGPLYLPGDASAKPASSQNSAAPAQQDGHKSDTGK